MISVSHFLSDDNIERTIMVESEIKRGRIPKWDNVKGVLILLVVIGHMVEENVGQSTACKAIFLFIYSFHMPLFIFCSGYFYSDKRIKEKVFFYLCVGILLLIMTFAERVFICGRSGGLDFVNVDGAAWYMFAMAAWVLITYGLRGQQTVLILGFSLLLGCFSGYDSDIGDFLVLSRIIVYYPFYLTGHIARDSERFPDFIGLHGREYSGRNLVKITISAAVVIIWAAICVRWLPTVYQLRPFFTGRNPFSGIYAESPLGLGVRVLCYMITFAICISLMIFIPERKLPIITKMGGAVVGNIFLAYTDQVFPDKTGSVGFPLFPSSWMGRSHNIELCARVYSVNGSFQQTFTVASENDLC